MTCLSCGNEINYLKIRIAGIPIGQGKPLCYSCYVLLKDITEESPSPEIISLDYYRKRKKVLIWLKSRDQDPSNSGKG